MLWSKKTGGTVSHGSSEKIMALYNTGVEFLRSGKINKAIQVFSELVDRDHPSAMFNLALLYTQGHGERLMLKEAPELFLKAAKLGHKNAATFSGLFDKYQCGFQPGSGPSTLLTWNGIAGYPVLIVHAMAADIILRLDSVRSAIVYASIETFDLGVGKGDGGRFVDLLNFDKMTAVDNWVNVNKITPSAGSPEAVVKNIRLILSACVADLGMSEETALFIRCSVLGTVCKAHSLSVLRNLPPIDFYENDITF